MSMGVMSERDKEMRRKRVKGKSFRSLADEYGISRQRVHMICRGVVPEGATETEIRREQLQAERVKKITEILEDRPASQEEIAEAVGISLAQVRRHLPDELRHRLISPQPSYKRFSDEELLQILREVDCGDAPLTTKAYDKWRESLSDPLSVPTHLVFFYRLGSWQEAVRAAGRTPGETLREYKRKHTTEDLYAYVRRYFEEWEKPSRTAEDYDKWQRGVEGAPSVALLRQRLGKWNDIKRHILSEEG